MTVVRSGKGALQAGNKPDWVQTPRAGFFRLSKDGGDHDVHYHDYNEIYFVARGRAKILNDGREEYVQARDIVCIRAGCDHDILEVYGDEDFELFWMYEPGPAGGRFGHLHRRPEDATPHPVPARPLPADFPPAT